MNIKEFCADIEELLRVRMRLLSAKGELRHLYAKWVCENLLEDIKKIERKYTE